MWSSIKGYLSIALGASLVASNAFWYVKYDWQGDALSAALQGRIDDRKAYQKAQLEAEVKQLRENEKTNAINKANAEKANLAYDALLGKYRASLVRYQDQASRRSTGHIDLSSASSVTNGSEVKTESSGISISISLSDADICAENTAKIMSVYEWAKTYK